jgi:hypothetical protein
MLEMPTINRESPEIQRWERAGTGALNSCVPFRTSFTVRDEYVFCKFENVFIRIDHLPACIVRNFAPIMVVLGNKAITTCAAVKHGGVSDSVGANL